MTPTNGPAPGIAAAQEQLGRLAGSATPDYEQIRRTIDTLVPFVNLVGVRLTELGAGSAVAEVPVGDTMLNHLGTVHAGALFLAAEVACAGAFSGAIAQRILDLRTFVLRDSRLTFVKPARGRIRAAGTVSSPVSSPALSDVVRGTSEAQFELTGHAALHDENGTLVAKAELDYFAWLGGR